MALNARELRSEASRAAYPRVHVAHDGGARTKKFAAAAGAPLLSVLTPVSYDTSVNHWKVWASGGANGIGTIRGFTYPDKIQLSATEEVHGVVLLKGRVQYADIVLPAGQTADDLKTALRAGTPTLRELGLDVVGLEQIR